MGSKLRDGRNFFLIIKASEMKERDKSKSSLGVTDATDLIFRARGLGQKVESCCW